MRVCAAKRPQRARRNRNKIRAYKKRERDTCLAQNHVGAIDEGVGVLEQKVQGAGDKLAAKTREEAAQADGVARTAHSHHNETCVCAVVCVCVVIVSGCLHMPMTGEKRPTPKREKYGFSETKIGKKSYTRVHLCGAPPAAAGEGGGLFALAEQIHTIDGRVDVEERRVLGVEGKGDARTKLGVELERHVVLEQLRGGVHGHVRRVRSGAEGEAHVVVGVGVAEPE